MTSQDKAIGNLPLAAQEKLRGQEGFHALAQALVRQYVKAVESLQEAQHGRIPRHFPPDLRWREKKDGVLRFFSTRQIDWKADLEPGGGVGLVSQRRETRFLFESDDRESHKQKLVRTVSFESEGERITKRDAVDLETGLREPTQEHREPLPTDSVFRFNK